MEKRERMKTVGLKICLWLFGCWACLSSNAKEQCSPNHRIRLEFNESVRNQGGEFRIMYTDGNKEHHEMLSIPSFGIITSNDDGNLFLSEVSDGRKIEDHYEMLSGKRKNCHNEATEWTYTFKDGQDRKVDLIFRLYNDGVAFRYKLYDLDKVRINGERTQYRVNSGLKRWMQKYDMSYENFFPETTGETGEVKHWAYPALFQVSDEAWMLLSEAGISRNQSASSLKATDERSVYQVSPAANEAVISGEWVSPWRVAMIGSLSDIVESTLITDVSEPCKLDDTDWIRPGVVSWVYWAYNRGSKDYQIVKQYIDMADKLKLPYILIDWEWDVMGNGGNIDDALAYARERQVRTLLWYNSSTAWTTNGAGGPLYKLNAPADREKEFSWLEDHGVAGVKIDFFSGDTQETMDYCLDLLESAADHHLTVNFHGATLPRGWQRTYPNLMSVEAVYGAEWYNNAPVLTNKAASHNATLPFTRNVVGSMDYTPCTFTDSQHPHITSNAHELALTVVFESALQHLADRPEGYLSQPEEVRHFFGELPTVWDDTKLLSGYPGHYVVMARRKGNKWYIGGLNGSDQKQTLTVDCSFLGKKKRTVLSFEDSGNPDQPWQISEKENKRWSKPFSVECQPRGGFVWVIE